jgi:glycosyltransferase involved in cell wall biosynthesis
MHTAVFSIISPNYRHHARVLMQSLERHHPEWERFVLLVGGTEGRPASSAETGIETEPFTTVHLEELPLPRPREFCFRYTLLELNTAAKPWMFEHLFARGFDRVVYFDPDIVVYSALAELDERAFLTLTPHLTGSIPGDEHPSERSILMAGSYNLGFLAVTRQEPLARFLRWWQEKLELQCIVDPPNGLFVDQKWMDLTPGLFPNVAIVRHDGWNVAYWNLPQRTVEGTTVNGQPLRFLHFSGFDPAVPSRVSRHDVRQTLAATGGAAPLFEAYAEALIAAGARTFRTAAYGYGFFDDGTPIADGARVAYRESPELQNASEGNPFAHRELFWRFRDRSRSTLAARAALHSYRALSQLRPLVSLVPRPLRRKAREFLLGRKETARAVRTPKELGAGLDVIGYFSRYTGVAESARRCVAACDAAGISSAKIDLDSVGAIAFQASHRAAVFHVNADQTPAVLSYLPQIRAAGAYHIGCWHWELPEVSDVALPAAALLDEIWAPSAFIQSALSRKVTIPVVHLPHGIEVTEVEHCTPQELGVEEGRFTFLFMFDFGSVPERKNALGAIEAFRSAFAGSAGAALLIKTTGVDRNPDSYAALKDAAHGAGNVHVVDRTLTRPRINGLMASSDAVVSLHRSEGFGLILAEAMDLGKPVIATGWSGNMDFMNSGNSCPVAYELVTLDRAHGPYEAGQQWAEPDLDHAAHLMRRIVNEKEYREQIGRRARSTIRERFSPEAAGRRYRSRLVQLGLMDKG